MLPRANAMFGSAHSRTAAIFKLFCIVRLRRVWEEKQANAREVQATQSEFTLSVALHLAATIMLAERMRRRKPRDI